MGGLKDLFETAGAGTRTVQAQSQDRPFSYGDYEVEASKKARDNWKSAFETVGGIFDMAKRDFERGDILDGITDGAAGVSAGIGAGLVGWTGVMNKPEVQAVTSSRSHDISKIEKDASAAMGNIGLIPQKTEFHFNEPLQVRPAGSSEGNRDLELDSSEAISNFRQFLTDDSIDKTGAIEDTLSACASSLTRGQLAKALRNCGITCTSEELDAFELSKDKTEFILNYADEKDFGIETSIKFMQNMASFGVDNFEQGCLRGGSEQALMLYLVKDRLTAYVDNPSSENESKGLYDMSNLETDVLLARIVKQTRAGLETRQENVGKIRAERRTEMAQDAAPVVNAPSESSKGLELDI